MWHVIERHEVRRLTRRSPAETAEEKKGLLPQPSLPPGTDLLPQIKHIVVLMMENHSYDNYLGMLQGRGEGFPLGPDSEPDVSNTGADGEAIRAFHLPATGQHQGVPDAELAGTHQQWGEGKLDGFVTSAQAGAGRRATDTAAGTDTGADPATAGMGYWTEAGPAVLLRAGPHLPAGRPLVLLVPGPHLPQPPVPDRGDRARPDRRLARTTCSTTPRPAPSSTC